MTVKDVFFISGKGAVVVGTVENGTIAINETISINNKSYAVSRIQQHRKLIYSATAGMEIGILLSGTKKTDFEVGNVIYKSEASRTASKNNQKRVSNTHHHSDSNDASDDLYEITCPACNTTFEIKEAVLYDGGTRCPSCGEQLEFEIEAEGADPAPSAPAKNSSGCYVATAVYGSYDCPQVWTLRRYRDETLAQTWHGRAFIHTYYAISPTLVKWFGNTHWFKAMWRGVLDRMVTNLQADGVAFTPYEDNQW